MAGIHNGENTHHQDQSILSNILAKKKAKKVRKHIIPEQFILIFVSLFSILFILSKIYKLHHITYYHLHPFYVKYYL